MPNIGLLFFKGQNYEIVLRQNTEKHLKVAYNENFSENALERNKIQQSVLLHDATSLHGNQNIYLLI